MPERLLVIDTATPACSAALFEDEQLIAHHYEEIGRGHAERIVPMIADLPAKGNAGTILVNCGPGSFTGVRIGISVARALGLAWQANLVGYQCLHLVAAQALEKQQPCKGVCVVMHGGHGEYFVQNFGIEGHPEDQVQSLVPEEALKYTKSGIFAGSAANDLAAIENSTSVIPPSFPDASKALLMNRSHHLEDPRPVYGRKPDAVPSLGSA